MNLTGLCGSLALAMLASAGSAEQSLAQTKAAAPPPAAAAVQLEGGASALTEVHGDWTVTCQVINNKKACSFAQQQVDSTTKQRLLALELSSQDGQTATGALALPFGLLLASGVTLSIDDAKLGESYPFRTCLPVGCLVALTFAKPAIESLKAGTVLKVSGTTSDTNQPIEFTLSLKGFSGALGRTSTLSN